MLVIYLLTGIATGILSSMGIGGGTLLIPVLCQFFNVAQKEAQLINLLSFILPSIIAFFIHSKNSLIDKTYVFSSISGGIPTAILGAIVMSMLTAESLKIILGIFMILIGIFEIFDKMVYNIINQLKKYFKLQKTER